MATMLGKLELKSRRSLSRAAKRLGLDFEKEEREFGFAVAVYNTGWLAGSKNGYSHGFRDGKKAAKARRK